MTQARQNLDQVKDRIKSYLPMYLSSMGYTATKMFKCFNPDHQDRSPSCHIVPGSDGRVFFCFGCGISGDIFTATYLLEGKPVSGRGFIQENLLYLANRFGEPVPDMHELSEQDLLEIDTRAAYLHASMIVKASEGSDRVKAKIMDLGWNKEVRAKIGIGSVTSYEAYLDRMQKHYGHKMEFLEKVDLAGSVARGIFNENSLIYTVKDENGAPVGFQARDLRYEEKKTAYEKKVKEIRVDNELSPQQQEDLLEKTYKPRKYLNTSDRCTIYQKGTRLFNIDQAKKYAPPLWVLEGNPDAVTAFAGGMLNSVAIGSTAFTPEHLKLILSCGIKHIVFCLDADQAGETGTDRFIEMLKEALAGHIGVRVEIVTMPEGTDDPDSFIRSFGDLRRGVEEFRKLPRTDVFAWTLRKRIRTGCDPLTLAEEVIPFIVNEPNNLLRMGMTKKLAQETGLDESGLWREVTRQVDIDRAGAEEEKVQIARKLSSDLLKHPERIQVLLEQGRVQIEGVEKRKTGYDPRNVINAATHQLDQAEKNARSMDLTSTYPLLDQAIGGVPFQDCFISVPGKPNHSKTTFLENLAWKLPENNDNCRVLMHTMDDAISAALPRLMATKFDKPTNWFKRAGFYRNQVEDFDRMYSEARKWVMDLIERERLILADVTVLPSALSALEVWVRSLRSKFPNDYLVVLADNFAQYTLPGYEGEALDRNKSATIKRIANEYHVTMVVTCELPKGSLRPGIRPRMANIKGTSGVAYDANANFGIYNDLKDFGEKATIFWDGPNERIIGPSGEELSAPKRMPIVELVIDKSKLSSFDGSIFYRLNPDSGAMTECSEPDQVKYRDLAAQFHTGGNDRQSYAPHQNAF